MKQDKNNMMPMNAADYRRAAEHHKQAAKNQWKTFLRTGFFALAALVAVAVLSVAWFANNKDVRADNSTVTTSTPTALLFISNGESIDKNYYNAVSLGTSKGLYPISTVDCMNWYYVSKWKTVLANPGVVNDKTTKQVASGYTKVMDVSFEDNDSAAKYTVDDRDYYAYYKHTVNVYTDRNTLDVYLNPTNPISVEYSNESFTDDQKENADKIRSAIRIAVAYKDENGADQLLYYVPQEESGKGNSANAKENTYQGINGTGEENIVDIASWYNQTTIKNITAEYKPDSDSEFQAKTSGSLKLGTADSINGIVLNIYVWLEGTDAQTLKDITAGISDGLQISLSVVGVEPTA